MKHFEKQLPVDTIIPELRGALARGHAVLSSPPGSGKTTRVPLALLGEQWLSGKKIIMLEPRRPAARMAAYHMARQLDQQVGQTVGYQVRFDRKIGVDTRVEVLTEGLFTRRLQADPELAGVGLIIFDEFHERNLQADLGLALCLDVCAALREDLRILVMSATLDEERVAGLLSARVVKGDGGMHPVDISFLDKPIAGDQYSTLAGLVKKALTGSTGDVLVFLPGVGEIRRLAEQLESRGVTADLKVLHGQLDTRQQEEILLPREGHARRVVLTTDIAETSLTIEGITAVVDSGLAKKPVFDPNTGLSRLETGKISRASATQRAGRAGRLGPGYCYRAWTEPQHQSLEAEIAAEILQADLSSVVLELGLWGVSDPAQLKWLDPPAPGSWAQAVELLQQLSALDEQRRITPQGKRMARQGLSPRLAHLLVVATDRADPALAADMAALLSERDPMRHRPGSPATADLSLRLGALADLKQGKSIPADMDRQRLLSIRKLSDRLFRQNRSQQAVGNLLSPAALLSLAFPERIAARRPGSDGRFLLSSGRGAWLPRDDSLAAADFLAVAHMDAGKREGKIWLAMALTRDEIEITHGDRLEMEQRVFWEETRQTVLAREEIRLDQILLESRPVKATGKEQVADILLQAIRRIGMDSFNWTGKARQLQARIERVRSLEPEGRWPDVSDDWLLQHPAEWLLPWLDSARSIKDVRKLDLVEILGSMMDWQQRKALDRLLPRSYTVASGARYRIDYLQEQGPVLAVPLQEMYGVRESPTLVTGRIPVMLQLLSPAQRPLQLTRDLGNFWQNAYTEVKKEMKGRYPKHHWPDDPLTASPVRLKKHLPDS